MSKVFSLMFAIFAFVVCAFSQTPTPTPPDDVVKITTNLIQVDVTVKDANGRPIRDLRPDEIEIYENGQKQKITNFSFISAGRPAAALNEKPASADAAPVTLPPITIDPSAVRRTIALVVDDLSLSFESVYHTRRTLKKFVDEQMLDGDLVAIVRTGGSVGALQQFTNDKRILYAAIESVKYNPMGTGRIAALPAIEPSQSEKMGMALGGMANSGQDAEVEAFLTAAADARNSVFAAGTLGSLQYIIAGMGRLPEIGRAHV